VYAFSIGDAVRHFHLHLVPRYADTPERLRGRRCFEGRPEDMLPESEVDRAAGAVAGPRRPMPPPAASGGGPAADEGEGWGTPRGGGGAPQG
jgi:diadenosine tetraphosphate (Ap4A) HIT family hydrolase